MLPLAVDWGTISALATGIGTLVLAVATFASVRSANRSARIAEIALQEQRRPVLAPSRLEDPPQKLMFVDGHWLRVTGAHAAAEEQNGNVYLAISLRNVGSGIGVCQGWTVMPGLATNSGSRAAHAPLEDFRLQTRDLYIPAGDIGMWQGALRGPEDPNRAAVAECIDRREPVTVELLYSDQVGRQRTITRLRSPAGRRRRLVHEHEPPLVSRLGRPPARRAGAACQRDRSRRARGGRPAGRGPRGGRRRGPVVAGPRLLRPGTTTLRHAMPTRCRDPREAVQEVPSRLIAPQPIEIGQDTRSGGRGRRGAWLSCTSTWWRSRNS